MDILRCDSCAKPLGEGAVGRAEAFRRDSDLLLCRACVEMEGRGHSLPIAPPPEALSKWARLRRVDSEKIATDPVLLDGQQCIIELADGTRVEGRVVKAPGMSPTIRQIAPAPVRPSPQRQSLTDKQPFTPSMPAAKQRPRIPVLGKRPLAERRPLAARTDVPAARVNKGIRSPYALSAILLMTIVLPAFALSLYMALLSQDENNELHRQLEKAKLEAAQRPNGVRNPIVGDPAGNSDEPGVARGTVVAHSPDISKPETPSAVVALTPAVLALPLEVRDQLRKKEQDIAAPVVARLASNDRGERLLAIADAIRLRAAGAAAAIRALASSDDACERQLAASALGELRDIGADTRELLGRMANTDPSPEVQIAARRALTRLDGDTWDFDLAGFSTEELKMLERALDGAINPVALRLIRDALGEREGRSRG